MVKLCLLGCALATAIAPGSAHAFSEPLTYIDDARHGGGGGRWFTSSPAEGYGCSVCHTGGGTAKLSISGLPEGGYTPGMTYEISMAWPEFAARARQLRELGGVDRPSMGLTAELVAESGLGAGQLDLIDKALATPAERCVGPGDTLASELYVMLPGEEPPDEPQVTCNAVALGQRCILTAVSCGAEQVRARWTAPLQPVGPIWFAAGFVTTDALGGTVVNDAVLEVASPMQPVTAGSERYESVLKGGCTVVAPGARGAAHATRSRDASLPLAALLLLAPISCAFRRRGTGNRSPGRDRA